MINLRACALLAIALAGVGGAAGCGPLPSRSAPAAAPAVAPLAPPRAPDSDADRRIAFYEGKLRTLPGHYPSLALLASAQLDKGKETGDPSWIAAARASVERSLALQVNVEAIKAAAAIASYSHRFAEALAFARQAREIYPADTAVASLEVESRLGLGDLDAAEAALATFPAEDFHAAFARGLVAAARRQGAQAATTYALAAERAATQHVTALQLFALVSAAGALLDAGDPVGARPYLDRAAAIEPHDRRLRIHRTEWLEATGHPDQALAALEALLTERDDPELHRRVARLARAAGDGARAQRHVAAARAAYQRAIAAGEVYTLEGLSYLLSEAGLELPLAVELATRNLEHKRDASARAALARAQARLSEPAR